MDTPALGVHVMERREVTSVNDVEIDAPTRAFLPDMRAMRIRSLRR